MKLPLIAKKQIARETYEITLGPPQGAFAFKAGQYVLVATPALKNADARGSKRNFSITSSPLTKNSLAFAFRASSSSFKQFVLNAPMGTLFDVEGPFGVFTLPAPQMRGEARPEGRPAEGEARPEGRPAEGEARPEGRPAEGEARPEGRPDGAARSLVFVAGGIGIAPFLSMIRFATEEKLPHRIILLYANASAESTAYLPELEALAKQNSHFTVTTKFGALDEEFLRHNAPEEEGARWYIAGPPGMVASARAALVRMRVREENILTEEFSGYDEQKVEEPAGIEKKNEIQKETSVFDVSTISHGNLQAILQALNNAAIVSMTDLEGTITYANDKFCEISKYSREELIGQNHRILKSGFHPQSFYNDMWHNHLLKGKIWRGEIKNKAKDGSFYWVDASIAPIFDARGEKIGYIGIRFVITERENLIEDSHRVNLAMLNLLEDARALEAQLKEERNSSRAIISSMSEGLFIVDTEYRITSLNPAASAFLEITQEEAVGQDVRKLIKVFKGSTELAIAEWPISQVFATGAPAIRSLEDGVFYQLRSGKKIPVVIFASPLRGEGITGVVVVFRDVTDEYKLNEAKNEFVSVASHQLRTPLTAVRWYSEMLMAGDAGALNENQKGFVEQVYAGAGHLIDIINVLLSLARIEGGRIKIDPVPIDIPVFMKEIVEEFAPLIREKKLSVSILPPDHPQNPIRLDASLFRQVAINLLSNAVRYAPAEKGIIEIGFIDQGDHAQVFVKDNGIGIPQEQKDRIFEKFFRADNAINEVPEGTGLGLNLAQKIVHLWKGKIWFRSPAEWTRPDGTKEMKGTSFHFIIPYKGMEARFTGKPLA